MTQLGRHKVGVKASAAHSPTAATVGSSSRNAQQSADDRPARAKLVGGTEYAGASETGSSSGAAGLFAELRRYGRNRELPAGAIAAGFLAWLREHELSRREWTVDDVWYLAAEDFSPALGFALPPRRVFLGALQKCAGVIVQYDKRIYDREGRYLRKTTFYRFAPASQAVSRKVDKHELSPLACAA